MKNEIILREQEVFGREFVIYGTVDEPLFVASDIADLIGHTNVSEMLKSIDDDEKLTSVILRSGQSRQVNMLTENGLYEVLMLSRKPIAKKFKSEVKNILKSIRKNGGYIANQENLSPEQIVANALIVANNIIQQKDKQIEEMKPKAEFFDSVADSKTAISMNEVAKVLNVKGYGRNNLFEYLRQNKILQNNNVPYQRYVDSGWFRVIEQKYMKNGEPVITTKTLVYQKGVDAIRKMLKGAQRWTLTIK